MGNGEGAVRTYTKKHTTVIIIVEKQFPDDFVGLTHSGNEDLCMVCFEAQW